MKQNPLPGKLRGRLGALLVVAVMLTTSGCVTPSRSASFSNKPNPNQPTAQTGAVININTASAQQLKTLPGVGDTIAERIVAHRQQFGPFRRAEHLMMVRGISDRKFRQMQGMITVE
ncbi:MAG TPA: helix-hairpin-helix domain-containing protein [Pyrinomonadaceae bacterium]|nr:helix-hairpin-helix domain-containing protein [Pyrinomonadaceae bacterium]